MSVPLPSSTYPAQFVFCGTAFRGKRAPKALKKYFGFDMTSFEANTPWRIPVDELPPLLSDTASRRWAHFADPNLEAGSSNDVLILPSTRFLASGEETSNAPWVTWGADVVAVCVFLEDRVTTEKRLQQVSVCIIAPPQGPSPKSVLSIQYSLLLYQSLPPFAQLPAHSRIVVVGFRLQPEQSADLGLTDCDMRWEEANMLMSTTHPSIGYFVQIETTLERSEDKLYQLFAWLVARRVKRLPTNVREDFAGISAK